MDGTAWSGNSINFALLCLEIIIVYSTKLFDHFTLMHPEGIVVCILCIIATYIVALVVYIIGLS